MTTDEHIELVKHVNRIAKSANELVTRMLSATIETQDDKDYVMMDFSTVLVDVDIVRDEFKKHGIQ